MKNIHINNSYNIWSTNRMYEILVEKLPDDETCFPDDYLNRSLKGIYIEWYLHNIGYWITLPFIKNETIKQINYRCQHVDLEEHK